MLESGKVDMYGIDGPGDKLFRIKPSLGTLNFNFPNDSTLMSDLSTQNYEREDETNVCYIFNLFEQNIFKKKICLLTYFPFFLFSFFLFIF